MTALEEAYLRCESITRAEARNFAYGIRLLPHEKRRAMSALYAFARRVDDIGDGTASSSEKLDRLGDVRAQVGALARGEIPIDDPVLVALGDTMARYPLKADELLELVAGCEMDCAPHHYETFEDLVVYCRCVAGSIGRLSLEIFGSSDPSAPDLADELGVALQVTNILRDILEDREVMGRVYLPGEDLRRFGCAEDASGPLAGLCDVVRFEAGRAKSRYVAGLGLLDLIDHRSRSCVGAMAGIYRRLLGRIEANPALVFERRVSLPGWEKAWVAARALAGVAT